MKYLDVTFPSPQHNLACDEALILWCEDSSYSDELLRFWEPPDYFVVLGYSGKIHSEIDLASCQANRIPILRRCSGGGTVLQGPGCLNYSLILRIDHRDSLQGISQTNSFVLGYLKQALEPLIGPGVEIQGHTDLAVGVRKFSGNAQYRKRHFVLFHGTFLLHFDISFLEKLLPVPSKQPAYRQNRTHGNFLTNLNLPPHKVKEALKQSWSAREEFKNIPLEAIERLARERYSSDEWNLKF
jgi:lipoate-protein ligase A